MLSLPSSPVKRSFSVRPHSVSSPAPPKIVSAPADPSSRSASSPPETISPPKPPKIVSAPTPPASLSSPALPVIQSLPPPPSILSCAVPPLAVSSPVPSKTCEIALNVTVPSGIRSVPAPFSAMVSSAEAPKAVPSRIVLFPALPLTMPEVGTGMTAMTHTHFLHMTKRPGGTPGRRTDEKSGKISIRDRDTDADENRWPSDRDGQDRHEQTNTTHTPQPGAPKDTSESQ